MIDSLRTGKESPKNSKKNMRERKSVVTNQLVYEIGPVMVEGRKYYGVEIKMDGVSTDSPRICGLAEQTPRDRCNEAILFCVQDIFRRVGVVTR